MDLHAELVALRDEFQAIADSCQQVRLRFKVSRTTFEAQLSYRIRPRDRWDVQTKVALLKLQMEKGSVLVRKYFPALLASAPPFKYPDDPWAFLLIEGLPAVVNALEGSGGEAIGLVASSATESVLLAERLLVREFKRRHDPAESASNPGLASQHDGIFRERGAPALPGTFKAQRLLAAEKAETLDSEFQKSDCPELAALYSFIVSAWVSAVDLAAASRSPGPIAAMQFIGHCTRLNEYHTRAEKLTKRPELWQAWPKSPGTTFSWKGGDSALAVAFQFARGVYAAVAYARLVAVGGTDLDPLPVAPEPDDRFNKWRDETMQELQTKTLPPVSEWPMWQIHRDRAALESRLYDEWEIAQANARLPQSRKRQSGNREQTPQEFSGGKMVYYKDRVELCGVDICSGSRSGSRRVVLELLSQCQRNGKFVAHSGDDLEALGIQHGAKGSAAGWIRDLRRGISERLSQAGIVCGHKEVILSGETGYRFSDRLTVQFADTPTIKGITDITDTDDEGDVPNDDVPNVRDDAVGARRAWVLQELAKGRQLKAPDLAEHFSCSVKTAQRDLTALKDAGKIAFSMATRTGYYRLRQGGPLR